MSDPTARAASASVPRGDVIGTYETYAEAQSVVDRLAKAEFDVSQVAIIGNDLKTVERVTGKLSWGKAALSGAANGAFIGLFFALLLTLFNPDGWGGLRLVAAVFLVTAGVGVILGLIGYAFTRRRRDFASTQQVLASNYQVVVPGELAAKAQVALSGD
ncbi:MAG: hypothetical protein BGO95_08075 [Micrococcales bacterium 73-13]|nr:MAG: hypothetical protein BGO95_08075 [Micrococcales bacterium 73-13]